MLETRASALEELLPAKQQETDGGCYRGSNLPEQTADACCSPHARPGGVYPGDLADVPRPRELLSHVKIYNDSL